MDRCLICGGELSWQHDHKSDQSGIDDGPLLPGNAKRKKPEPKDPAEVSRIRKEAWETRRQKYGAYGHR